uniref:Uncharacterized protein n=1 Tax=Oryza punctata TaxID=4537 RepID=A0A0E0LCF0_ORYPU
MSSRSAPVWSNLFKISDCRPEPGWRTMTHDPQHFLPSSGVPSSDRPPQLRYCLQQDQPLRQLLRSRQGHHDSDKETRASRPIQAPPTPTASGVRIQMGQVPRHVRHIPDSADESTNDTPTLKKKNNTSGNIRKSSPSAWKSCNSVVDQPRRPFFRPS